MNVSFYFDHIRQLDSGGYGDLWLARRRDTGDLIVVKYLRESQNLEAWKAFQREIRILQRNLPGLVRLLGVNSDPNSKPFYVMEYLAGGQMTQWAGRLTAQQLRHLALEVAQALAHLHAAGISHGDVKPQNMLLARDGHWQVADPLGNGWGCTVLFSENRGGTPGYWAPEVKDGSPISPAGDVFSLGATIYHVATGVAPRDGDRLGELIQLYELPSRIKNAVVACCASVAGNRPKIGDVIRILHGESWAAIQEAKSEAAAGWLWLGGLALGLIFMSSIKTKPA